MTADLDAEVVGADAAAEHRDEVVTAVTEHAGRVARELARLQGGDYGQETFETAAGAWTLKYEAGDVQYLRFERRGTETYVVSTHQPPEPEALAEALADYDAFVAAFNDHVRSLAGVLDDAPADFPDIASVDDVVAERERVLSRMREACDAMAQRLRRYEGGDYGSFAARVDGSRWELKWEASRTSYLRVGGEGGIYLLSQYQPPSAHDLRAHADGFAGFVDAFNEEIADASDALDEVAL